VAVLLLIPLIAMQFTDEVNWSMSDFIVAAVLLLVAVFTYELISRKVKAPTNRTILSVTLLIIFLLIWAELAVGIFGTPFAGS
jgi:succinate-acetate transporter protein